LFLALYVILSFYFFRVQALPDLGNMSAEAFHVKLNITAEVG
jgi:hypothetical protein